VERRGLHAAAVVYGYWGDLDLPGGYHLYYGPGVSAGVFPTHDGACCVFASVPAAQFDTELGRDPETGHRHVIARSAPDLSAALASARRVGKLYSYPGIAGYMRRSWGPGWALVGDAGYFKDPATAHGISDALRDAELLARAVGRGGDAELAAYQRTRDELSTGLFHVTDAIASFEWDLARIQELHPRLSREMKKEVELLSGLPSLPAPGAAAMVGS
jgi:2-polyprenyl-6-methoxyphenol hydroxylase-like FAD-dependent oxidoreductase